MQQKLYVSKGKRKICHFFCHFPVKVGSKTLLRFSIKYLSNKRGGCNKRGGWADFFFLREKGRGGKMQILYCYMKICVEGVQNLWKK